MLPTHFLRCNQPQGRVISGQTNICPDIQLISQLSHQGIEAVRNCNSILADATEVWEMSRAPILAPPVDNSIVT